MNEGKFVVLRTHFVGSVFGLIPSQNGDYDRHGSQSTCWYPVHCVSLHRQPLPWYVYQVPHMGKDMDEALRRGGAKPGRATYLGTNLHAPYEYILKRNQ